jgi:F-type H+-transporting ATPase subunit a
VSHAPIQERTLFLTASTALLPYVTADDGSEGGFHGPSLEEFFPEAVLFQGTPFELNRVMIIRLIVVVALVLLLWLGTRKMKIIPGRGQAALEFILNFVRKGIVIDTLGEKDGKRFMPILMTFFFLILGMNLTGTIPPFLMAGTSVAGLPILLAVVAWVMMVYAGLRRNKWRYLKNSLFLPGVPWPLYFLLTPIELISTFVLRPVTLFLRLLMNMVAGHMLLVLCFSATQFFLFTVLADGNLIGLLGIGTFGFGVIFTFFEIFVAALQAYVFTFLATIYIQMSLAEEH